MSSGRLESNFQESVICVPSGHGWKVNLISTPGLTLGAVRMVTTSAGRYSTMLKSSCSELRTWWNRVPAPTGPGAPAGRRLSPSGAPLQDSFSSSSLAWMLLGNSARERLR